MQLSLHIERLGFWTLILGFIDAVPTTEIMHSRWSRLHDINEMERTRDHVFQMQPF
jgi:hypothetical protein